MRLRTLFVTLLLLAGAALRLDAEPIRKIQVVISKGGSVYQASILYKIGFNLGGTMEDSRHVEYQGERELDGRSYHVFSEGRGGYDYYTVHKPGEGGNALLVYMTLNMPVSRIFKDGVEVTSRSYVLEHGTNEEYLGKLREAGDDGAFAVVSEPVLICSYKDPEEITERDDLREFDAGDYGSEAFAADVEVNDRNVIQALRNPALRKEWLEANEDQLHRVEVRSMQRINGNIAFYALEVEGRQVGRLIRYDFGPYVVYGIGDPNVGYDPVAISIGSMAPGEYELVEGFGDKLSRWGSEVMGQAQGLFGIGGN